PVRAGDQRDHEGQERQHHGGVGAHLLAVRPDHLPKFGDGLLQVGDDEAERVAWPVPALGGLGLAVLTAVVGGLGGALRGLVLDRGPPGPLAGRPQRPRRHRRLPAVARRGVVVGVAGRGVGCGAGWVALVAHRMLPYLVVRVWSSLTGWSPSSVHASRVLS